MEGEGEVVTTGVTAPFSADMRSGVLLLLVCVWGGGEVDTTGVTAPFSADMRSGFLLLLVWGGGGELGGGGRR